MRFSASIRYLLFALVALVAPGPTWAQSSEDLIGLPAILIVPSEFATIQQAINVAENGSAILVAPGTYTETINFLGKAIQVTAVGGPYETIIDAQFSGRAVTFNSNEGPSSILEGFTIRGGRPPSVGIDNSAKGRPGGGIYCFGSSPTIKRCIIVENQAGAGSSTNTNAIPAGDGGHGGGLAAVGIVGFFNCAPTVVGCVFVRNKAGRAGTANDGIGSFGGRGGAIYAREASIRVLNCTITANRGGDSLSGGQPGYAGGVFFDSFTSSCELTNTIFFENITGSQSTGIAPTLVTDLIPKTHLNVHHCSFGDDLNVVQGQGNIESDPDFLDAEGGDYRLDFDSPCVDGGLAVADLTSLTSSDIDDGARIRHGGPDIGADETVIRVHEGTNEELLLRTRASFTVPELNYANVKSTAPGHSIALEIMPTASFLAVNYPFILVAQPFVTGSPSPSSAGFPELHLDPTLNPAPIVVIGGSSNPFAMPTLPPGGLEIFLGIPLGTEGHSVMFQAIIPIQFADNGIFMASDGHEIRIQAPD